MDIKHTEFTASSKKIEITGDRGAVKIVKENVQVNVVSSKAAAEPPVDEMLPEEVFFTEAALVEPAPEKPFEEERAAETEEDSEAGTFFTEAALFDPVPEEIAEEESAEETPVEGDPAGAPSPEQAEIKAIAGIEARKAGAVAAAGVQALTIAMEKRESGAVQPPKQSYDSFADLEAVEMMAIEMVKKEQAAKAESAEEAAETATAGEASIAAPAEEATEVAPAEEVTEAAPAEETAETVGTAAASSAPQGCPGCPAAENGCPAAAEAAQTAEATAGAETEAAAGAANEAAAESAAADSQSKNKAPRGGSTVRVIGVRFRTAGKVYYFDPGKWQVRHGTHVIVETVRGIEYGTVVGIPMDVSAVKVPQPLKEVIRVATPEDAETERRNREKEREAYRVCQEKIRAHGLEMKLINAEYTFDNSKVLFYFTADGRVDFRDLVKDLASVFRTRIELRQIGVRDETKILGGYGICGRPLCCHTWMSDFIPVSIKMAKEQNLSLNPGKISGVCGRLMCCLKNESETYEELNRSLPKVGDEVQGKDGLSGQVESVNVLRQTVRILVEVDDEKEYHEYGVDDITVLRRRRRGGNRNRKDNTDPKEAQELERLENQERQPSRGRGDRGNRGNREDRQERSNGGNRQDRSDNYNGAERRDRSDRRNNRRRNSSNQSET